jgi:hypothetical protein
MPKVSLTYKDGVQKGPAPDYSMLLEMKRRHAIVADARAHGTNGRKETGIVVDGQHTRGFAEGPVTPVFNIKGARSGFFKF